MPALYLQAPVSFPSPKTQLVAVHQDKPVWAASSAVVAPHMAGAEARRRIVMIASLDTELVKARDRGAESTDMQNCALNEIRRQN